MDETVYRGISPRAVEEWRRLSATRFFQSASDAGKLINTEQLDSQKLRNDRGLSDWAGVLKHERVPFVSYPYEWSFTMMKDAALLHLELLEQALDEGMILKDSSSYNIQWFGARPVFIDIPSFEHYAPGSPWIGYRQFCEMFLYPLLMQAYKDIPFHAWLRGSPDGIPPAVCNSVMTLRDRLRAGVFADVYLQAKLQNRYATSPRELKGDLRRSGFKKELITSNVRRLTRLVGALDWKRKASPWSKYPENNSYSNEDAELKENFVRRIVSGQHRDLVWDLGCNTGRFSRVASENSGYVVALDGDHVTVENFYLELKREARRTILPLLMNVADPSPGLGWRSTERKPLEQRTKPGLVMCLALLHHLVIGSNIPVLEILDWLASLGGDLIIEFVTKDDPMSQILLRNKDDHYADYELSYFEKCLQEKFRVVSREPLTSGTRYLYFGTSRKES